jgi:hypothetical protein
MNDFTTIRNNVNIYRLDEYYQYLEEKNNRRKALLMMRKNMYLKRFLGAKVGSWRIIGVFESEGIFALTNGVEIMYMKAEDVISFMKALQERI